MIYKSKTILILLYAVSLAFLVYMLINSLHFLNSPSNASQVCPKDNLSAAFGCGVAYGLAYEIARGFQEFVFKVSLVLIAFQLPIFLILLLKNSLINKYLFLKIFTWLALIPSYADMLYGLFVDFVDLFK